MDNLDYSNEAQEAKALFYNSQLMVFVEGEDDIKFWDILFQIAGINAYIEEVGGKPEIEKKIYEIENNDANFIVACDSDYNEFLQKVSNHKNIILTYGYSIENSMYSTDNIEKIIQYFSRSTKKFKNEIDDWKISFADELRLLVLYDISNEMHEKGISVIGKSCLQFMKTNNAINICPVKISKHIEEIKKTIKKKEVNKAQKLLEYSAKDFWFHIKGHFLTNGIINFIKHSVRKNGKYKNVVSIPLDSLYALTVDCSNNWKNKTDIKFVVDKIKSIKS